MVTKEEILGLYTEATEELKKGEPTVDVLCSSLFAVAIPLFLGVLVDIRDELGNFPK